MMNENNGIENIAKNIAKKKILLFLFGGGCGTTFWIFMVGFPVFIAILVVLGLLNGSNSGNGVCHNYKSVDEICKQMVVNGQSMSVDEYVAHVITNEFGSAPDETLKAQAVASRSYGLNGASKDGNGNCIISDTSEGFQTYAKNYTDRAMQAAMDTSGVILVDENGAVARSEYSSNSLPNPYSSYGSTIVMSERNLEIPRSWWQNHKTCGDSTLNSLNGSNTDAYGRPVYGCGHGRGMGQIAAMYLDTEKGYNYEQILEFFYGKDSKYNWSLASTNGSVTNSNCGSSSNGNFQALSSYNIGHKNLKILSSSLSSSQVTDLNSYINTEVDKAGYGTGAGVAAAGQSLVYGLEQLGYYLGYCWGGDRTSVGVGTKWGTKSSGCNSPSNVHQYYGMDCSGFVSWAIRNGCTDSFGGPSTYEMEYGPHIDVKKAKPGDIMLDTDSHVRLVIKNNGDGTVIVAEEGGNYGDLGFSKVSNEAGYNFIDMSSFYSKTCKSTNPATGVKRGNNSLTSSSSNGTTSKGKKSIKILLIAGHSYSPYCSSCTNECRGDSGIGYAEESETRKLVKKIKSKLNNLGYKNIDIANQLLGENFSKKSTTKSLYCEYVKNTKKFQSINWGKYDYALEIHFNGSSNHSVGGVTTIYDSPRASNSSLDLNIRQAINDVLNNGNNGEVSMDLHNTKLFAKLGVTFTYLEVEYYDNKKSMDKYAKNSDKVASAISKAIDSYNSKSGF